MTYIEEKINYLSMLPLHGFSREASVIVAWPTSNDGPLKSEKVLDLTRFYSGPVSTLIRALLGAEVIRIDEPRRVDAVRFSTAFCTWLHMGGPLL